MAGDSQSPGEQLFVSGRPSPWRLLWIWTVIGVQSLGGGSATLYLIRRGAVEGHGDREAHHRLEEYQRMARELGAKVVNLNDKNVSDALIRFAQQESISHVVFGQSARSRFDILFRGSVLNRFLSEVRDVTVQVVPMQKPMRKA